MKTCTVKALQLGKGNRWAFAVFMSQPVELEPSGKIQVDASRYCYKSEEDAITAGTLKLSITKYQDPHQSK